MPPSKKNNDEKLQKMYLYNKFLDKIFCEKFAKYVFKLNEKKEDYIGVKYCNSKFFDLIFISYPKDIEEIYSNDDLSKEYRLLILPVIDESYLDKLKIAKIKKVTCILSNKISKELENIDINAMAKKNHVLLVFIDDVLKEI